MKFVAKEQPPSGMFNIEWRIIIATDTKHEIDPNNVRFFFWIGYVKLLEKFISLAF